MTNQHAVSGSRRRATNRNNEMLPTIGRGELHPRRATEIERRIIRLMVRFLGNVKNVFTRKLLLISKLTVIARGT